MDVDYNDYNHMYRTHLLLELLANPFVVHENLNKHERFTFRNGMKVVI
jgi:hypothetical protein